MTNKGFIDLNDEALIAKNENVDLDSPKWKLIVSLLWKIVEMEFATNWNPQQKK